jgi:folylpolyglutamate synthase/dihydropteroate synthase
MGTLANHWQGGMLDPLRTSVPKADFVATTVPGSQNSMSPGDLAAAWGRNSKAIADTDAAFEVAVARARGTLIVCGSLYLVGYLRNKVI